MLETCSADSSFGLTGLDGTTTLAAAVMVGGVGPTDVVNEVGVVFGEVAMSTVFRIPPGGREGEGEKGTGREREGRRKGGESKLFANYTLSSRPSGM